jgi:hypothetical protein
LVAAVGSMLLFAWFTLFLVDGIHNGLQRVATVLIGISGPLLAGHACELWRKKRLEDSHSEKRLGGRETPRH